MTANFVALYDFFSFCRSQGMEVRFNRGWIDANILFEAGSGTRVAQAEVRLSIDAADRTHASIDARAFDPTEVPGDYSAEFGKWKFAKGALTVDGRHPVHGRYRTVLTFLRPVVRG